MLRSATIPRSSVVLRAAGTASVVLLLVLSQRHFPLCSRKVTREGVHGGTKERTKTATLPRWITPNTQRLSCFRLREKLVSPCHDVADPRQRHARREDFGVVANADVDVDVDANADANADANVVVDLVGRSGSDPRFSAVIDSNAPFPREPQHGDSHEPLNSSPSTNRAPRQQAEDRTCPQGMQQPCRQRTAEGTPVLKSVVASEQDRKAEENSETDGQVMDDRYENNDDIVGAGIGDGSDYDLFLRQHMDFLNSVTFTNNTSSLHEPTCACCK